MTVQSNYNIETIIIFQSKILGAREHGLLERRRQLEKFSHSPLNGQVAPLARCV